MVSISHPQRLGSLALAVIAAAAAGGLSIAVPAAASPGFATLPQPVAFSSTDGGAHWATDKLPAGTWRLDDVACGSATNCVAVGNTIGTGKGGGVETEQFIITTGNGGKTWAITSPPGVAGELLGVTCPGAASCIAVGYGSEGSQPIDTGEVAEVLVNGKVTHTYDIPDATFTEGRSISCVSMEVCNVIGTHFSSGNFFTTAVDLSTTNGGVTWTHHPFPPNPFGKNTALAVGDAVSCVSETTCVAGGQWQTGSGPRTGLGFGGFIVSTTDGGAKWTLEKLPFVFASIDGLQCEQSVGCVAVGQKAIIEPHGEATGDALVTRTGNDDGTGWEPGNIPRNTTGFQLHGVTCVSRHCLAVGSDRSNRDEVLASADGGADWTSTMVPAATNEGLEAVRCGSATSCQAVG